MGSAGTLGALGSTASATSTENEVSKTPLPLARVDSIVGELQRDLRRSLDASEHGGKRTTHPEHPSMETVYVEFDTAEDVRAVVVRVQAGDEQKLIGNVRAPFGKLREVPSTLRAAADVSTRRVPEEELVVDRYVGPEADEAVVTRPSRTAGDSGSEASLADAEPVATVDVATQSVNAGTYDSFTECVIEESGITDWSAIGCGVGICGTCVYSPNPPSCIACAACAAKIGCFAGACGDTHLSSIFCYQATVQCAVFPISAAGCPVAWGCHVGDCTVLE